MKKLVFLSLLGIFACQKGKSNLNPTPQGGEGTEGGGGAFQFYVFYTHHNNNLKKMLSPIPPLQESNLELDYNYPEEILADAEQSFLDYAQQGIKELEQDLNAQEVARAYAVIQEIRANPKQYIIWRKNIKDRNGVSVWALNSAHPMYLILSPGKIIGFSGLRDITALCEGLFTQFQSIDTTDCMKSYRKVKGAHEILSIIGVERDGNYLESQKLFRPARNFMI